ncbi:hypothetical protein [Labedaea rhizosphaerae]|uniref:Uncharacterized protein n=1 Tax=Labedaea rhizosphaerae TaxID=598644 RepID=A0A4R6S500_LABRH|nr:hypothetical protein [Labedaea rhizosphaerae]TDP94770.1 hypothetical protein EV186_1052 [Labedaea rhizosphaerae]
MDQVDETTQRIIEAAIALYDKGSGAVPDVYAYFDDLVPGLPEAAENPGDSAEPHTPVLPP